MGGCICWKVRHIPAGIAQMVDAVGGRFVARILKIGATGKVEAREFPCLVFDARLDVEQHQLVAAPTKLRSCRRFDRQNLKADLRLPTRVDVSAASES